MNRVNHFKITPLSGIIILGSLLLIGAGCNTLTPFSSGNESVGTTTPPTNSTTPSSILPKKNDSEWKLFKSEATKFEISYPSNLIEAGAPSPFIVFLSFPKSLYQGTNLINTKITVDYKKSNPLNDCLANYNTVKNYLKKYSTNPRQAKIAKVNKNSLLFYRSESQDLGNESIYHIIDYELPYQGSCYKITLGLQTLDRAQEEAQSLIEFNKLEFVNIFEGIVSTFKILTSDTSSTSTTANTECYNNSRCSGTL